MHAWVVSVTCVPVCPWSNGRIANNFQDNKLATIFFTLHDWYWGMSLGKKVIF